MTARHDENTQQGLPRFYTLAETARTLRKSERWLWDWLKHHQRDCNGQPFFRLAGRTKLFSLDDVMRLFKALPCPSDCDRHVRVRRRTSKSEVHTSELLLNEVRELLKRSSHRKYSATLKEPLNVATSKKGHRSVSKQNLHS